MQVVRLAPLERFSLRLSFSFCCLDPLNFFRNALAEIRRFPVFLAFREAGGEREWGGLLIYMQKERFCASGGSTDEYCDLDILGTVGI